ncbi:hypothetical protein C2E20_4927 [Micractinium conductrix]|uniref:Uncharacterized protein n=1 Tax=Micractinium conductrix TaxID=554055 RepID=A0A2P6VCK6_9CHLO|nr:hypothetical protein C2E20_4927 [Micractinium conductrix]|eukprot:PSC71814.1 hypothetical protein C2E20_4927 [Micractinium conductrix]
MGDPVERTVSAVSANSDGGAAVSESLQGLVNAVDELKQSMGMGQTPVDFAAVEQYVQRLRQENEEFRQFAEEAILSAQRLRDERDALQARLDQTALETTMGAALAETQKLKDVADEFERDLHAQKLAEAEARAAEAEALQERIAELEEENAGLTQTLNEFRQTTHQLQRLQSHEVRRLQKVEATKAVGGSAGSHTSPAAQPADAAPGSSGSPQGSPKPLPAAAATPPYRGGRSAAASPAGVAAAAAAAAAAAELSAQAAEATRLAEQLEDVAGGADSGLLAEAAVALRELAKRDAELVVQQQENARLRTEVDDLNDTMFNKTFKPPSAWAEREIKYKSEKKYWEEQHKEVAARVAALTAEMAAYRGTSKAQQLEERIQELEAALLHSEREKDGVRSQLHEVQLSLRTEGEFGSGGKRLSPYRGPVGVEGEGHEVQQMVDNLEQGSMGTASPEVLSVAVAAQRLHGLEVQLQAAASENQALRRQLAEQRVVAVPASLQEQLGQVATAAAVTAAAADIEARLQEAEAESTSLRQQLVGTPAPAPAPPGVALHAQQQVEGLEARAAAAEAAGDAEEAEAMRQHAAQLQGLTAALRRSEEERLALEAQLGELAPVRLHISTAAAEAGEEEAVPVPAALQGELGASAPPAALQAKASELEQRASEAAAETGALQQQLGAAVALERAAAAAAQQQQQVAAQLEAREAAGKGDAAEVEDLRQQLAAAQRQKEVAQQQLWQLQELQEQLQAATAERRRLGTALAAAAPISLQLAVGESAEADQGGMAGETAEVAELRSQLGQAQRQSDDLLAQVQALQAAAMAEQPVSLAFNLAPAEAPVQLALRVGGGGEEGGAAAERLQQAEVEVERLRQQLADLQPVRFQLALASPAPPAALPPAAGAGGARRSLDAPLAVGMSPGDMPGLTAEPSTDSLGGMLFDSEQATALSKERAAADAAWREHQKATDVPSLLRAKAELETRCQMLESQIAKMQGELAHVDEANAVFEDTLESALKTGDVSVLSGLKDKLASGRHSLSKRMFSKRGAPAKGGSPSKDTLRNTVHEMQDALTSSEEEKNALKRQLAKLSKKYQQVAQQAAHTAGIVAGAAAMQRTSTSSEASPEPSIMNGGLDEDGELELMKMREENQMLMEHVVMVKVRHAEMEGEYLESKRQLLRTREKNLALAHKLQVLRDAAERGDPLPFTPTAADVAAAAVAAAEAASRAPLGAHLAAAGVEVSIAPAGTPRTEGKKKLRIPGL